jgi:hypothetical protein
MKRFVFFVAIITTAGVVHSQMLPKKSYMRLQGYLNDQVEVMMNLVKVNDSIYADFYLTATSIAANEYNVEHGTPQVVGGRISADGSFTLRTPFDPQGTEIRGKFVTRQTMTGTWQTGSKGTNYRFSLTENYPGGSMPLSVWYQTATKPLVSKSPNPRAFIEQCLVVPAESGNPVSSDTVRKRIMTAFSPTGQQSADPQVLINSLQQSFFANYLSDNTDLYKQMPDAGSLNWDLYKLIHIVYNGNTLLSFCIESYAFTGGAHGLGAKDFAVINSKTGKPVRAEDLFVKNYEPVLTGLLTSKLKKMEKLQPGDKLSEKSEYFVDDIGPNSNFYITGNGIGFFYNHYEIAPYAHGYTDIFLSFEELAPVLRADGLPETLLK